MFRSLFCLQGTDTRSRFIAIVGACWAMLLILPVLFGTSFFSLLFILPAGGMIMASAQRVSRPVGWPALLLLLLYVLAGVMVAAGWPLAAFMIALSSLVPTLLLARAGIAALPGVTAGYLAPGQHAVARRRRREPVFGEHGEGAVIADYEEQYGITDVTETEPLSRQSSRPTSADIFEQIGRLATSHPKMLPALMMVAAALVVLSVVVALWPTSAELAAPVEAETVIEPAGVRDEVKLPDDFSLALVDEKLVMSWLGDKVPAGELWSLASAKGDKRCATLTFNDGSEFRPVVVNMTQDTVTEAWFSPLDARGIVRNIAMRGSAKLCGYKFSLKGTQSRLEANKAFAQFL
ncbi:MAG: DUF805 domain-containing protein [Shewanella sp.]|nr:DUF805 domain-containing protein [Shewanella sp.]MCF1431160.1 DUF805 domain-containing protein [Shewanella sp.]MCF1438359.1 DUF805 domain-containing protein [Shewanella sp.]MCF1457116.1 DUF805 domain-containing protein [Shewanella sp.]